MLYIGLDVHKEFCQACVIDERGRALSNERFPSTHESLDVFLAGIKDAKFVLESTGIWEYIYEGIEDRGFEVVLAHPLKVRAIAEARVKTDKVDAETLAQLLRADLIPRSWVPSRDIRDLRQLVRQRAYLARQSTSFKNRISAELLRRGAGDERATAGRVQAETRCTAHRDYPGHRVLRRPPHPRGDRRHQQVPRPGEPSRIWGVVPTVRQSASTVYYGGVSKEGSAHLRWKLTEMVHIHKYFHPESRLSRFHSKLEKRRGKNKATIATARKLVHVIYWMLKTREPYHSQGFNPVTKPARTSA